jgi:uncharacterized membrane protein (Fun14 family)
MTRIQMISVLFVGAILAKQSSMVNAIPLSIGFWMILAKYLKVFLILFDKGLDNVIYLDRYGLISVEKTIVLALTTRAFKLALLSKPLGRVFLVFDHLCRDTHSACSFPTTVQDDRLSLGPIEPQLTIEAAQRRHI